MFGAATSTVLAVDGWLYQLLRWAGVGEPTAAHVQQVLVKPLSLVLVVVVAALVGWLGNRVIRHWIGGAMRRAASHAGAPRAERRANTLTAMAAHVWRVVVGVVAFFVALGTIGLDLTPLLAGATIIGATIGFGAQSVVKDFLSGFLLTVEGQFDIGDTIVVGTTTGVVEDLTLRVTRLRGADGEVWYVPNGDIRLLGNSVRGWGRATIDVPVSHDRAVDQLLQALRQAADAVYRDPRHAEACLEPPVLWGVVAVDADTVTGRVTVRTRFDRRDALERAIREEAVRRLQQTGLEGAGEARPPLT